ncbi:hypothetical protein IG631_23272 [Alternaria alternata]|nr:hypothetical protein IG631_23272 [Alternaria alternata]
MGFSPPNQLIYKEACIGRFDDRNAEILRIIREDPLVELQLMLTRVKRPHQRGSLPSISAILYGPKWLSEDIGAFCQDSEIYLQDPLGCDRDVLYCNPHRISSDQGVCCTTFELERATTDVVVTNLHIADALDVLSTPRTLGEVETPRWLKTKLLLLEAQARWAVTGTPLQNRLGDVATLCQFLRVYPYDDRETFNKHIIDPWKAGDNNTAISRLKRLLQCILLRRSKGSVQLPERTDLRHTLQLSEEERQHYATAENNVARSIDAVLGANPNTAFNVTSIIQQINELRLICDLGTYRKPPKPVSLAENNTWNTRVAQRALNALTATNSICCKSCGEIQDGTRYDNSFGTNLYATRLWLFSCFSIACESCMARNPSTRCSCVRQCPVALVTHAPGTMDSGASSPVEWPSDSEEVLPTKVNALVNDLLKQMPGTKSIVFTFWSSTLDLIEKGLSRASITFTRYDGNTTPTNRSVALNNFRRNPDISVILMTISCAAVGLNITAATRAYIMEPQWNPTVEEQALARVHRMGQTKEVTTIRYVMADTFEEAPSEYADLTAHVRHLRDILDDTKTFLVEAERQGHIPQSQTRLASLQARHDGCNTTLDEVDDFLKKYKKVETEKGRRRIISLAKFIMSDAKILAKKLEGEASSLQLRLTSLTSLSVLNVRDALTNIAEDYRTGVREPTVISRALVENEPIDRQELLEQISQDLEDSNIHPDSISLNMSFVDEWLSQAISSGTLEEGSTAPLLPLPTRARENKISSVSDTQHSAAENSGSRASASQGSAPPPEAAQVAYKESVPCDDGDLYADIDQATTRPDDSITVLNGGIALQEARSRANSTASSASKPDDWHPYDRPEPTYVRNKLQPLLIAEPTPDPLSANSMHAIMRAFHQADYRDEGSLTRHTVLFHLRDVLKDAPWITYSDDFESMVLRFDANHDGYFELDEIHIASKRNSDRKRFRGCGKPSKSRLGRQKSSDTPTFSTLRFRKSAWSHLAWEAKECVSRISDFETEWIGKVPKTLQDEYLVPLRKVQRVAIAFTLLENKSSPHERSDLDKFLDCSRLSAYLHDVTDDPEIDRTSSLLVAAKSICKIILDNVLGFTFTLKSAGKLRTSNYNNFGEFKSWWDRNRMTWRSNKIVIESAKWNVVEDAVNQYSKAGINKLVVIRAHKFITIFRRREIEKAMRRKKRFTEETPWEGHIEQAVISGLNQNWISKTIGMWYAHVTGTKAHLAGPSKIFLKISIYDDQTLYHANREMFTTPQKRAAEHSWRLGPESNMYVMTSLHLQHILTQL